MLCTSPAFPILPILSMLPILFINNGLRTGFGRISSCICAAAPASACCCSCYCLCADSHCQCKDVARSSCYLYFELRRLETQVCLLCVNRLLSSSPSTPNFSLLLRFYISGFGPLSVMLYHAYIAPPPLFFSVRFATTTLLSSPGHRAAV